MEDGEQGSNIGVTAPFWAGPLAVMAIGYLLGSIPFGLLLTRAFGAGDLRTIGSGNIGATNVLRTGNKPLAAATLALDAGKGALAILLGARLLPGLFGFGDDPAVATSWGELAAIGAFFGHIYPAWLGFRGGKGVASLLGIALALEPVAGLVFAAVWVGAMLVTRFSSVGGMAAAVALPVAAAVLDRFDLVLLFLAFALIVLWKHGANIARLIDGTEPRIGER